MNKKNLGSHILPTSGAMVGVCMTVISILKFAQVKNGLITWADEILALDSVLFLLSAFFSYLSIRTDKESPRSELIADKLFVFALVIMCAATLAISFEIT